MQFKYYSNTLKIKEHHAGLGKNRFLNDLSLSRVRRSLYRKCLMRINLPLGIHRITFFPSLIARCRLSPARNRRWKLAATFHCVDYLDYAFNSGTYVWISGQNHRAWRGQLSTFVFSFSTISFYASFSWQLLIFEKVLTTLWRKAGQGLRKLFTLIPSNTRVKPVSYCCGYFCQVLGSEPQKCS